MSQAVRLDSDLESIISEENMYNDIFSMTGKTDNTDTYFSDENINSKYLTINEISDIAVIEGGWRLDLSKSSHIPSLLNQTKFMEHHY